MGYKRTLKSLEGRLSFFIAVFPLQSLRWGERVGNVLLPQLSPLLSLGKGWGEVSGHSTSHLGTCACRVVRRVHSGGKGMPSLSLLLCSLHTGQTKGEEQSHTCLHGTQQQITQPTPSWATWRVLLQSPRGDLVKGGCPLGFVVGGGGRGIALNVMMRSSLLTSSSL